MTLGAQLNEIFLATLALCDTRELVGSSLQVIGDELHVSAPMLAPGQGVLAGRRKLARVPFPRGKLFVLAAGKAAQGQAWALLDALGARIDEGLLVVPESTSEIDRPPGFKVMAAGHPSPNAASQRAAEAALALTTRCQPDDLLICAISGGASALLAIPVPGLSLEEKSQTTSTLLRSGLDITGINAVRKRLSGIKGGRLALATSAPTLCIALGDVPDERIDLIGSGPAVIDPTSAETARRILDRRDLWHALPTAAAAVLRRATDLQWPEGKKPPVEALLAGPRLLLAAASAAAVSAGFRAIPVNFGLYGEVTDLVPAILASVESAHRRKNPSCVIWVGEPTVQVQGEGQGGRCGHLALLMARELRGQPDVAFLAAGSDGVDGTSGAAGAVVDGDSWQKAQAMGLEPANALAAFDSGPLHLRLASALQTGPTGVNFADLLLLAVLPEALH